MDRVRLCCQVTVLAARLQSTPHAATVVLGVLLLPGVQVFVYLLCQPALTNRSNTCVQM